MIPPVRPTSAIENIKGFEKVKGYDGWGDGWGGSLTAGC